MANTGYWMPFEAAKAIAATFCWKIRFALTPVFGPDFPKICLRPEADGFADMVIDPAITQRCTEQANFYRQLELETPCAGSSAMWTPLTPESPSLPRHVKQLRPKTRRFGNAGSGYTSDSSFDDRYTATSVSPTIPYCNTWTPANTPRSVGPSFDDRLPSPREILAGMCREAMAAEEEDDQSTDSASTSSTTSLLLKSRQDTQDDVDDEYEEDGRSMSEASIAVAELRNIQGKGPGTESSVMSDEKAAYLLLKLSMESSLNEATRREKRRAST
jgi:hypothetical protein